MMPVKKSHCALDSSLMVKAVTLLIMFALMTAIVSQLSASTSIACKSGCYACFVGVNQLQVNMQIINEYPLQRRESMSGIMHDASDIVVKPFSVALGIDHPPRV